MSTQQRVKVRIARPSSRPWQLRYKCPITGKSIRITTSTRDDDEVERQRADLEAKLLLRLPLNDKREIVDEHMPWKVFREKYSTIKVSAFLRCDLQ